MLLIAERETEETRQMLAQRERGYDTRQSPQYALEASGRAQRL